MTWAEAHTGWSDVQAMCKDGVQVQGKLTKTGHEHRWRYVFEGSDTYWHMGLPSPSDLRASPVSPPALTRKSVLDQAAAAVLKNRVAQYGGPEDSFGTIAEFWTTFLRRRGLLVEGRALSPADATALLALLKLARLGETITHPDSWVDLAGYAACGGEVSNIQGEAK